MNKPPCIGKVSKSVPDKAQSGASLVGLRALATPCGADSRHFYSANLRFGTLAAPASRHARQALCGHDEFTRAHRAPCCPAAMVNIMPYALITADHGGWYWYACVPQMRERLSGQAQGWDLSDKSPPAAGFPETQGGRMNRGRHRPHCPGTSRQADKAGKPANQAQLAHVAHVTRSTQRRCR